MNMKRILKDKLSEIALAGSLIFSSLNMCATENNKDKYDYTSAIKKQLIEHEGYRNSVYRDTKNKPTIGIGFNLTRQDAHSRLEKVGAQYDLVIAGKQKLTDEQIRILFERDVKDAVASAKRCIRNYDAQPEEVKSIVIDMVFNLGEEGFRKFVNTRKHIEGRNYTLAAEEMKRSLWYKQVGNRGARLVEKMSGITSK
jgi:lysozyme